MNIVPKDILLDIIKNIYENTPDFIKREIAYIGLSGSYLFNLDKENSDYDISLVLNPDLEDERIIHHIKVYFASQIRNEITYMGYKSGAVDVHTIRRLRWTNTNNIIALFCMKYQIERSLDLCVTNDDVTLVNKAVNFYFNGVSYENLLNDYIKYNKCVLSGIYHLPEELGLPVIQEVFYHIFLMYNIVNNDNIYSDLITHDDINDIKSLVKGKINFHVPKNNHNYEPMSLEEQSRLYSILQEKIRIVLNNNDIYGYDETIDFITMNN